MRSRRRPRARQAEARQVVADAEHARRVVVQRRERAIGKFQDMPGLAPRRGAGVEHAHAWSNVEQRRGELGAGVLYRYLTGGETRAADSIGSGRSSRIACAPKDSPARPRSPSLARYCSAREAAPVDAQGHRRMQVAGVQHRFPLLRPGCAHAVYPPLRVGIMRGFGVAACDEGVRLAQIVAQHRVGEAFCRGFEARYRAHRLIHRGMGGSRPRTQLVQRGEQQRVHGRFDRLVQQLGQDARPAARGCARRRRRGPAPQRPGSESVSGPDSASDRLRPTRTCATAAPAA